LQEEALKSNESKNQVSLKNERDAAARPMRMGSERLHETLLSRYEDSVKSVEIKSNYQNIKIADGNFEEIVRQFTLLMRKGGGEAKLLLQPEHLGSVKLRIQLDRGEVATSIIVDNQAVRDLILSRLNILEESLLEHGFNLGSFEVGVKGENAGNEAATETAKGNPNTGTVDEITGVEDEMPTENAVGKLPWMSTRVNITV
jgi:flagellar hook-length control protein FliK